MRRGTNRSIHASVEVAHARLQRLATELRYETADARLVVHSAYRIGLLHAAEQLEAYWRHWQAVEQARDQPPEVAVEVERVLAFALRSTYRLLRRSRAAVARDGDHGHPRPVSLDRAAVEFRTTPVYHPPVD